MGVGEILNWATFLVILQHFRTKLILTSYRLTAVGRIAALQCENWIRRKLVNPYLRLNFPAAIVKNVLTCKLTGTFVLFLFQSDKSVLLEPGVVEQNNWC